MVLGRLLAMEDGFVPKEDDPGFKPRAVRLVHDHLLTCGSVTKAEEAVGPHEASGAGDGAHRSKIRSQSAPDSKRPGPRDRA